MERRRKTACERRQQRQRAEARLAQRLLRGLSSLKVHRGCALTRLGRELLGALQGQGHAQERRQGRGQDESTLTENGTSGMEERRRSEASTLTESCMNNSVLVYGDASLVEVAFDRACGRILADLELRCAALAAVGVCTNCCDGGTASTAIGSTASEDYSTADHEIIDYSTTGLGGDGDPVDCDWLGELESVRAQLRFLLDSLSGAVATMTLAVHEPVAPEATKRKLMCMCICMYMYMYMYMYMDM